MLNEPTQSLCSCESGAPAVTWDRAQHLIGEIALLHRWPGYLNSDLIDHLWFPVDPSNSVKTLQCVLRALVQNKPSSWLWVPPDQSEHRENYLTNRRAERNTWPITVLFFKSDWPAVGEEQEVRCTDNHLQLPPVSQPICKPGQDHLTKGEEEGTECADYCPRLGCDPLNLWGDTQLGRQTSAQVDR